jgi:hypothetical protein
MSLFAASQLLKPLLWALLAVFGGLGILALVSPRHFTHVATEGSRWIDTDRILAWFDRSYDVDRLVLPFSRLLGALVVASVAVLALLLARR